MENIEKNESFKIENVDQASWAFRKLASTRDKMVQNEAFAGREVDRINKWLEAENDGLKRDEEYFAGLIRDYQLRVEAEDPKAKVSTPYGKVKKRTAKKWIWRPEALEFLKAQGKTEFIRTKVEESVDKTAIKKSATVTEDGMVILDTGELVEGVTAEAETTYTIEAFAGGTENE